MNDHLPDPDIAIAARLRRWLGPCALLLLVAAWGAALILPTRDAQRFEAERIAGLQELPEPPEPDLNPGIDGRPIDPDKPNQPGLLTPAGPQPDLQRLPPPGGQPHPGGAHHPPRPPRPGAKPPPPPSPDKRPPPPRGRQP
jgi:hypothetical protein